MDRSGGGAVDVTVHPGRLSGTIPAIPSKSAAHRLLILAALADGKTDIACPAVSKDILATANCLAALGAEIERRPWGFSVTPGKAPKRADLPCGESGSTLRFLLPVAAALGVEATFHLEGRLPKRPLAPLDGQLTAHGVTLTRPTEDTLRCAGQLTPGDFTLPGNVSSQYVTGLLLALPLLSGTSTLTVTGQVESAPYIALTEEALSQVGALPEKTNWQYDILPRRYQSPGKARVEGDWSNAAFFLAAGASVTGLDMESSQGDRAILELLRRFGASVTVAEDTAAVSWDQLHGIDIDAAAIPDLVPVLAVLAAVAEGKTRIYHAQRLRLKESDRLAAVASLLKNLGGAVEITADGLLIQGTGLSGGRVESFNDHRIAMAAAVAGTLASQPVTIHGAEAVEKSYPGFFEDFQALGGSL